MSYPNNSDFAVDLETLLSDLGEIEGEADEVSSANGSLRATIKRILEERGYHKAALADIRKINDMPTSKKADYLRTFIPMLDTMREHWDEQIKDMLDRKADETAGMEGEMAAE